MQGFGPLTGRVIILSLEGSMELVNCGVYHLHSNILLYASLAYISRATVYCMMLS